MPQVDIATAPGRYFGASKNPWPFCGLDSPQTSNMNPEPLGGGLTKPSGSSAVAITPSNSQIARRTSSASAPSTAMKPTILCEPSGKRPFFAA